MLDRTGQPVQDPCSWVFQSLVKTGCYRQPAGDVSPAILAERAEQEQLRLLLEEQKKTERLRFEAWRGLFEDPSPR